MWLSILVTILGYGGMFGAFTYIAFTLTEVSGFAASTVPWLLIVFGVGLFIGNTLGGRAADRDVDRTLLAVLSVLVVVLVVFALSAGNQVLTIASLLLLGGFGFATVPGLQMRVMKYAANAPTLASGANIGAFNVGNALGAWLGGVTITAGLGYTSPIWAGAAITLLGLVVMAGAAARAKATARRAPDATVASATVLPKLLRPNQRGDEPPVQSRLKRPTSDPFPYVSPGPPRSARQPERGSPAPRGNTGESAYFAPNGSRGSRFWLSQVCRTQPWCGSSLMSQSRTRPGPAMTLR